MFVRLFIVVPFTILLACTTHLSDRKEHIYTRADGTPVKCLEPPPDVMAKGAGAEAEVAAKNIGRILKGNIKGQVETERIREISKNVSDFEAVEFRLCQQYGNGVLTPEQYQEFQRLLPVFHEEKKGWQGQTNVSKSGNQSENDQKADLKRQETSHSDGEPLKKSDNTTLQSQPRKNITPPEGLINSIPQKKPPKPANAMDSTPLPQNNICDGDDPRIDCLWRYVREVQ